MNEIKKSLLDFSGFFSVITSVRELTLGSTLEQPFHKKEQ